MVTPQQRLALAVLALAADDAGTHDAQALTEDRRTTARDFLTGGPMLPFWCALAGLNPQTVATTARQRWTPVSPSSALHERPAHRA